MKFRKLINGDEVEDLKDAVDLSIFTRCPEKWILIDMETGQKYRGLKEPTKHGKWERLEW